MRIFLLVSLTIGSLSIGCSASETGPSTTTDAASNDSEATDTESAAEAAPVEGATFDDVYAKVLSTSCASGYCHGSVAGGWSVKADKDATHAELVGPSSSQCSGLKRVEPGDPEKSALFLKLRGGFSGVCKGNKMPTGGSVDAAQLELVRSWIAAGAKR